MRTYIVTCDNGEGDVWTYGPFETIDDAREFTDKASEKFPDIEYTADYLIAPEVFE